MSRLSIVLVLVASCFAVTMAQAPLAASYGPCNITGSYHLSCYAKTITAKAASDAKADCFKAWNNPACNATVIATFASAYGCDTAITYAFANDTCRDAYQAQEKTNTKCVLYDKNGLADKANRQSSKVISDYACPLAGPCNSTAGSYHLSCYAKTIARKVAIDAKLDCFKAWKTPACNATIASTYNNMFGCDTAITYLFANDTCRDAYQAQEKTNLNCKTYLKAKLSDPLNRKKANVAGDYMCPVPGPCKSAGVYHLSCYAKTINTDNATAAKNDCFMAWNQPTCNATVQTVLSNVLGCDTLITYSFATKDCYDSYQAQEKTNMMCALYSKFGLGDSANRQNSTAAKSYMCGAPKAAKKLF